MIRLEEFMDIFQLKEAGHTISSISRLTGRDRKTVSKYLAGGKNRPPQAAERASRPSKLAFYEEEIKAMLGRDVSEYVPATAIYERLVGKGYTGSLSLLQKWIHQYKAEQLTRVVVRFETLPGEQAQVDWGEKRIYDERLKRKVKVYLFTMTLGYSRCRFIHLVEKADMYHFQLCHQLAFAYYGGVPREILYDQNRCVLLKPGYASVEYNQRFLDFARHYGFVPRVCKPYRPQTKGKVESLVKYAKRNFLSLQKSGNLRELNRLKGKWLAQVNGKVHPSTGEIPLKRLCKEELAPIGEIAPYEVCYADSRRVFNDGTFSFKGRRYSVPPEYIGKTVTVKYRPENERLRVYFRERLLTEHRCDGMSQYEIKRVHRYRIWKLWRNEKRIFYQKAAKKGASANHPLSVYEAAAAAGGA